MMNYPFQDQEKKLRITAGTTPTITVTLPEKIDLTAAAHVYGTVRQEKVKIRKDVTGEALTAHSASFSLTQEETLQLKQGFAAKMQLNWTYSDGKRGATKAVEVLVEENVEDEVLE